MKKREPNKHLKGGNIFDTMNQENQRTSNIFAHMFGGNVIQGNAVRSAGTNSFSYGKPNKNQVMKN